MSEFKLAPSFYQERVKEAYTKFYESLDFETLFKKEVVLSADFNRIIWFDLPRDKILKKFESIEDLTDWPE